MTTAPLDLRSQRRIHIIAAGGAGMSAIATLLVGYGHIVSGSDQVDSETLRRLALSGVRTHVGHAAENLEDADLVVRSTAVSDVNVEVVEALGRGIPVLRRIDILPMLAEVQALVSVSGTHGKTTTTSMLSVVLRGIGADPSFLIGATVPVLGGAADRGSGRYLVLEADESDGSFLAGPRAGALVTNIEADHLEYWGTWERLVAGFRDFLEATDGPRVVCADDPIAAVMAELLVSEGLLEVSTYGTSASATYRMSDVVTTGLSSSFILSVDDVSCPVELQVPGLHNATNAAGALAMATELGFEMESAALALRAYTGVSRRFESRGEARGIQFVDDYAHLPTEVRAALAAARNGGWDRVVATFQPHRYSRTQALVEEFAHAFADADLLVLTDIYPAGEEPRPGVSGHLLFDLANAVRPEASTIWAPTLSDAAVVLGTRLRAGDICLSIGAGDVTTLADLVREQIS